jgi:hypothetical protein
MFNPSFFKKYKVEDHLLLKEWFLEEYNEWIQGKEHKLDEYTQSDYYYKKTKPYKSLLNEYLQKYITAFSNEWNVTDFNIQWWFAQYNSKGSHYWHTHPGATFACVYALELPNFNLGTELDGRINDIEEGDLIIFPGCWPHRSPANSYNNRKTVIAGNIIFKDLDLRRYE